MEYRGTFSTAAQQPALVLHWPKVNGGLWDPEVSSFVDALEDRLDIFVTSSGSGRGELGLPDAASAVRFMGCPTAVVVALEGHPPSRDELIDAAIKLGQPVVVMEASWSIEAIENAYQVGRRHIQQAA